MSHQPNVSSVIRRIREITLLIYDSSVDTFRQHIYHKPTIRVLLVYSSQSFVFQQERWAVNGLAPNLRQFSDNLTMPSGQATLNTLPRHNSIDNSQHVRLEP
jgi:hypothetical protein